MTGSRSWAAWRRCWIVAALVLIARAAPAQDPEIEQQLVRARTAWSEYRMGEAVAAWEAVLELDPENMHAGTAMAAVAPAMERTGKHLEIVDSLLETDHVAEAESALSVWDVRYASRDQRATYTVLRGRVSLARGKYGEAYAAATGAGRVAIDEDVKRHALLLEARALCGMEETRSRGVALLESVVGDDDWDALTSKMAWVLVQQRQGSRADRITACRRFLARCRDASVAGKAHLLLGELLTAEDGTASKRVLAERLAALRLARNEAEAAECEKVLLHDISIISEGEVLGWLAGELGGLASDGLPSVTPLGELVLLAQRRRASIEAGPASLRAARAIGSLADSLIAEHPLHERTRHWKALRAEGRLMEGQLLLMARDEGRALVALESAAAEYRGLLEDGDMTAGQTLLRIGRLLESRDRADAAARHYAHVARVLTTDKLGADALWRLGVLYRDRLDRPLRAVEAFRRYNDLYPPSFRAPTDALARVRQLGYADVARFQAAHGLKVDGILGPKTLQLLRGEEENFREILPANKSTKLVQGRMVHKVLFDIAYSLESRGRSREAIRAYQAFLSMYPGHSLGDDALIAVARIFKENDLFLEAAAAYESVMEDYPDGDKTSHAFIEGAYCYECLGEWEEAEDLYEMYVKKFPRYRSAARATSNLGAIRKLIRYSDLVKEGGVPAVKMADALYEIGRILYKEMGNRQKAVELFMRVADEYTSTYQAPDARFSAGTCLLHEQNYVRAREVLAGLVKRHDASRLADDAQYWIGHTYEYQARALGKLDKNAITLKKRSAAEVSRLHGDLELRRHFNPEAADGSVAWHEPHPDVLKESQMREQVRDDLRMAIEAYSRVVEEHPLGDMAQQALLRTGRIYSDYLKDTDRAIETYRALLEKYPGSTAAVDAQFTVGRHYLEQDDVDSALKAITLFLTNFPNHERAGDALLDLSECYRRRKEWLKALDCYQSYLNRYPSSGKAAEVTQEVAWIKKYRF